MFSTAQEILKKIHTLGYEAYIVGGAVRDFIMHNPVHDIDIAANIPLTVLKEHFHFLQDISKNMDIGVYLVEKNGFKYEIAHFRTHALSNKHQQPEPITKVSTFKEDTSQRDFTINAMGIDYQGNIIDFFGGRNDIQNKIIRTVGCAFDRFGEDFIRILRAVRFAARYEFSFDEATAEAISLCGECLLQAAPERIQTELEKMAGEGGKSFVHAIELMQELNISHIILPELAVLFELPHSGKHHPEGLCKKHQCEFYEEYTKNHDFCKNCKQGFNAVGKHVLESVKICRSKDIYQLFALLFHDIGKGATYQLREKNGEFVHTYYRHDATAEALINAVAVRLKWSNKLKDITLFCAKNHMILHEAPKLKGYTLLELMENPYFGYLVETSYCDSKSREERFNQAEWNTVLNYIEEFKNSIFLFSKNITGKRIMEVTGLKQGIQIGKILKATKKHAANHKILDINTLDDIIRFYAKCLK